MTNTGLKIGMYELTRFGLFSRQSATLTIGLNIGCSHNRDHRHRDSRL